MSPSCKNVLTFLVEWVFHCAGSNSSVAFLTAGPSFPFNILCRFLHACTSIFHHLEIAVKQPKRDEINIHLPTSTRQLVGSNTEPSRLDYSRLIFPCSLSSVLSLVPSLTQIKATVPLHTVWLLCQLNQEVWSHMKKPEHRQAARAPPARHPQLSNWHGVPVFGLTSRSGCQMNTSLGCQRPRWGNSGRPLWGDQLGLIISSH